jgi:hypothetical protein
MSVRELQELGLETMSDDEIEGFLAGQGVGVLGLPTEGAPYMLPLSYDYDGDGRLYFTYLLGEESRKATLTEQAERASFLVYSADSAFNWESVLLEGTLREPDPEEPTAPRDGTDRAWRPDILEQAELSCGVTVYIFDIEEQHGIKHTGLPPGFETPDDVSEH